MFTIPSHGWFMAGFYPHPQSFWCLPSKRSKEVVTGGAVGGSVEGKSWGATSAAGGAGGVRIIPWIVVVLRCFVRLLIPNMVVPQ